MSLSRHDKQAVRRLVRSEGRAYGWTPAEVQAAVRQATLDMRTPGATTVALPSGRHGVRIRTFSEAARMGRALVAGRHKPSRPLQTRT